MDSSKKVIKSDLRHIDVSNVEFKDNTVQGREDPGKDFGAMRASSERPTLPPWPTGGFKRT